MKITVLGASGRAGTEIAKELARRGHQVTGVARNSARVPTGEGILAVSGDVNDAAALPALLLGADAVVSAIMFVDTNPETLIGAVKAAGVPRYLVVGGAGSLGGRTGPEGHRHPGLP